MEEVRISVPEEKYKELIEKEVRIKIVAKRLQTGEGYFGVEEIAETLDIEMPRKDEQS